MAARAGCEEILGMRSGEVFEIIVGCRRTGEGAESIGLRSVLVVMALMKTAQRLYMLRVRIFTL